MILEAEQRGCLRDVLVLAAALSIQDPRERPVEHQQAADAAARPVRRPDLGLRRPTSTCGSYLREQQQELSSNQFRRMCRAEFLNYLRIREWQDLYGQLRQIVKGMGVTIGDQPADTEQIHRSLLSGLLSHVGLRDPPARDYLGARNARFAIFPGSALFKKQPQFVMAAELVETSRLWARVNAGDRAGMGRGTGRAPGQAQLQRTALGTPPGARWWRSSGSPCTASRWWSGARSATTGIDPAAVPRAVHPARPGRGRLGHPAPLLPGQPGAGGRGGRPGEPGPPARHPGRRRVGFRLLRPADSGLGGVRTALRLLVEEGPAPARPTCSTCPPASWSGAGAGDISAEQYPGPVDLRATSRPTSATASSPASATDGVTVAIPLPLLNEAVAAGLDWQVPGLRAELVTGAAADAAQADLRRSVVPIPDTAAALVRGAAGPADRLHRPADRGARRASWRGRGRRRPARGLAAGPAARPPAPDLPGARPGRRGARRRARIWPRCKADSPRQ